MVFKRIFAVLTAAALLLAMSSCGGDEAKRPEPELTEDGKKIVKVYSISVNANISDDIRQFNQFNSNYEVQLTEYISEYGEEAHDRLNADIAAGKTPDVIMYDLERDFPIESYAQKGALADFYELMDNDPDLSREDFSDVFKVFERDGKLYRMIPSFFIMSAAGKTSIVGDEQGITLDRFIELVDEYPDSPFPNDSSDSLLWALIDYGCGNFIDTDSGKCRFDSEEFIKLLEFCNQFPNTVEERDEDAFRKDAYAKRAGTTPFAFVHFNSFSDIRRIEYQEFGDPVTFIGFPGTGGNGSVIQPNGSKFSVFANGSNPEGGWEFVKYFLTKSYQNKFVGSGCFAVRRSALEEQAEYAKKLVWDSEEKDYVEPYYIDDTGKKIIIGVNTDEDNQRVYDLISGAMETGADTNVILIVYEEAGAYFSGQKSAKEVAEIIQNRVQNYLDESR